MLFFGYYGKNRVREAEEMFMRETEEMFMRETEEVFMREGTVSASCV